MLVHRLMKARHAGAPLTGEGARLVGGRWNEPGHPAVYCASTLSLAVVELLVHVEPTSIPDDLIAFEVEIPDDLPRSELRPEALPATWREESARPKLRALGSAWIQAARTAVLIVPSVIVPSEANALINPLHPDAARIRVRGQAAFALDPRLFT